MSDDEEESTIWENDFLQEVSLRAPHIQRAILLTRLLAGPSLIRKDSPATTSSWFARSRIPCCHLSHNENAHTSYNPVSLYAFPLTYLADRRHLISSWWLWSRFICNHTFILIDFFIVP